MQQNELNKIGRELIALSGLCALALIAIALGAVVTHASPTAIIVGVSLMATQSVVYGCGGIVLRICARAERKARRGDGPACD